MKLCKKLLSTFLAVIMIFSSFAVISVAAGDSLNAATSLTLGSSYSGSVTSSSASEFYKFSLSTSGRININLTANIKYLSFFVYDANGNEVWNYYSYYWNNTTQQLSFIKDIDLKAGTYYFAIKKSGDNYGNYNLKISFTSANESYSENLTNTNNTLPTASQLTLNTSKKGQIAQNDNSDIYKFTITESGRVNLDFVGNIAYLSFFVYDSNNNVIWQYYSLAWNSTTKQLTLNKNYDLTAGTYYLAFQKSGDNTGNYTFTTQFTSANESYPENLTNSNNTLPTASQLTLNTTKKGQIALNDNNDIYKFTITESGRVNLDFVGNIAYLSFFIYDIDNNVLWQYYSLAWNSTTEQLTLNKNYDLSAGTYYLAFQKSGDNTGNYTFTTQFTSANESFKENESKTDNTINSANSISLNKQYLGNIGMNDERDFFKFSVQSTGKQKITVNANIKYLSFFVYDASGNEVWNYYSYSWNSTTQQLTFQKEIDFKSTGTYYFAIARSGDNTGQYNFNIGNGTVSQQYTVTYNANGGSVSPSSASVTAGKSTTLPTPTKYATITYDANGGTGAPEQFKGYFECLGWSTSSSATSASYSCGSSYKPSSDVTLYAVWAEKIPTTLSTTVPKRDGYTFLGWSTDQNATEGKHQPGSNGYLKGNAIFYAVWQKNATTTYTVTYNANKGSVSPSSASVTAGNSTTLPTPTRYATITYDANGGTGAPSPTKAYFNCLGWATSSSATSASYACGTSYKPTSSTTLYAIWESKAYTNLSTVTPTRSGYKFLGWALTADATEPKFNPNHSVQLGVDDIVYAVWEKNDSVPEVEYKTIFLNYKDTYSINVDGYIAYDYISDNHSIVTVDSEGTVRANGVGSTDVYVYDSDYNVIAVYTFDVEYSWWQWILIIVLFGWIWY